MVQVLQLWLEYLIEFYQFVVLPVLALRVLWLLLKLPSRVWRDLLRCVFRFVCSSLKLVFRVVCGSLGLVFCFVVYVGCDICIILCHWIPHGHVMHY
jgi:hypothetical protein